MAEWHDIRDPNDPELDRLAAMYNLHPLHIEDCRHRNQSAKVEENSGYVFIVLKPIEVAEDGSVEASDLDIFLGPDFLITVQETDDARVRDLLDHTRKLGGDLRPDELLYRIADGVVDCYIPTIDYFNEVLDTLEDEVLERPTPQALARIFSTKRALIEVRRVLANTRDVANHLLRVENQFIRREIAPFLRDVYDHTARNLDMVEMQRDLLTGTLDIYLSSVANRTNNVMKALTLMGTITLPVLLVSSFYGMNIDALPWSHSPHGLPYVIAVMAVFTVVLGVLLRLFRWL